MKQVSPGPIREPGERLLSDAELIGASVYRSAIPRGLGVLVDIYHDGTYGLYAVKASPQCTGT